MLDRLQRPQVRCSVQAAFEAYACVYTRVHVALERFVMQGVVTHIQLGEHILVEGGSVQLVQHVVAGHVQQLLQA